MNVQLGIVLVLLVSAVIMFARNKPRMDAVALIMIALLPFTGVVSVSETLAGFADPNVVLIAVLFVVGDGLVRTGVAQRLGDWLIATAGASELRLLVLLMLVVCGLGAFMSSTGVVAIFIPIVLRIAKNTGTAASRLMMPLSFAALISGMTTLVATAPNLVINAELVRHGSPGFNFFSFTPFGLPMLALGIAYMVFARRWLSPKTSAPSADIARPSLADWIEPYQLADREHRFRVTAQSRLIGQTIATLQLQEKVGAHILAIERSERFSTDVIRPSPKTEIAAEDVLFVDLFPEGVDIPAMRADMGLEELELSGSYFLDQSQEIGMAELLVPADSQLAAKTVLSARLRTNFGLTVAGLRRGGSAIATDLRSELLRVGDTLLVIGAWSDIRKLQSDRSALLVLSLPAEIAEVLPAPGRAAQAIACLVLTVGLMVSGLVPNVHAALIGALLMGATGCVDLTTAYRAINWPSLVLIVGMLPFSTALERTGGVDLAADGLLALTGGAGMHTVLACLFAVTALLGLFISNTATAVLMAPVALAVAKDLGASPYPFAMIIALAASTAFMTPVSSPVNTLVVGPGNYAFKDFVRVGVPFSIVVMIVSVILVPMLLQP